MTVIYLEDLLAEKDFAKAVNGLSRRVRDAHDFPPVHQIGFVVPDVERAAEKLEDLGIGPFFIIAGRAAYWREKGELRDPRLKLGMAYHQDIQIELLEPVVGSDIHANSLHPSGKPVVEHLAFLVKDVDAWAEKLVAADTDLFVRATLKGIGLTADLAYMDKNEDDGLGAYPFEFDYAIAPARPQRTLCATAPQSAEPASHAPRFPCKTGLRTGTPDAST